MWKRSHSVVSRAVTKSQIWNLFADVNNWQTWDEGIEYAKLDGIFEEGNTLKLRPKGGPELTVSLLRVVVNERFIAMTKFPLARMYDDHTFEETSDGLKITITISVKGILGFLWVRLVAKQLADALPSDMEAQIKAASKYQV